MKKWMIFILFTFCVNGILAQNEDSYQYYPMAAGNYWYYSSGPGAFHTIKVYADSTDKDGNKYFWLGPKTGIPDYGYDSNYYLKGGPTFGAKASFFYKLNAKLGEQWWVRKTDPTDTLTGLFGRVEEITDGYYLGIKTTFKKYVYYQRGLDVSGKSYEDYYLYNEILAYGIGSIYRDNDAYYPYELLGAIINGKVIGNPVDVVENFATKLPDDFQLYQNYPNPFNPSTTIKFFVPKCGNISLSLFSILG